MTMAEAKKETKAKADEKKEEKKHEAKAEEKKAEAKEEVKKVEKDAKKTPGKKESKAKKKDKKEEKVDIVSENVYIIPLRSVYRTRPGWKRSSKAVDMIRKFLIRHAKAKEVRVDASLNEHIWARGDHKPPRKVQVKAAKDSNGVVTASLVK